MAEAQRNHHINGQARPKTHYGRLFGRFVSLTIVSSIIPLLLIGWAINSHYTRFARNRTNVSFQTQLEQHRKLVNLFLQEEVSNLNAVAQLNTKEFLTEEANLTKVFGSINRGDGAYTDLGVIDQSGNHLAYAGPYDLMDKNYSQALWFREIIGGNNGDLYISDMFLGFRNVPHFIIAVLRCEGDEKWILRSTIDTRVFRSIVEDLRIGSTGEVFLLNREGVFQTNPSRGGKIMEKASFPVMPFAEDAKIRVQRFGTDIDRARAPLQIAAYTWLDNPRWMLVIRQDYSAALYDANHANRVVLLFLHASALVILIVTILVTRHMISVIKERDIEVDRANAQFIQASRLASLGELSAGVAHEINNPLAIILSEKEILADIEQHTQEMSPEFRQQLLASLSRIGNQIQRCKRLTHILLGFSRRTQPVIGGSDINALIEEVVELVERDAATSGVSMLLELQSDLPTVVTDSSQLQQVFLNVIANGIAAHEGKHNGSIRIATRPNEEKKGVAIRVSDTGCGIRPEIMNKMFDPFFTTKPVGRGTGLGLSICYGILKKLGGDISVESEYGYGATFTVFLPYRPPRELEESVAPYETVESARA